jgi:GntR family histidine utilization transcriptional repressor
MTTTPRYQQLKEQIIQQISSGELRPLDRVPSENDLVGSAGVSRMTANRALRELDNEGYVERVAGKGTFVADLKATSHLLEVRNIADEIERRGHNHSARIVQQLQVPASAEIADKLQLDPGKGVFHVVLVHSENSTPIQYEDRYVVADFAPDCLQQDFSLITPSAYLSSISPLQEAEHVVRAEMPAAVIGAELGMTDGEPCLVVTRRTWAHGRVVSYALLYHPGSRYELTGHYAPPGIHKNTHKKAAAMRLETRR